MIKQFFFGATDSPLYMFHHALGAVLFIIFSCFLIAIIINWISGRKKIQIKISPDKIIPDKTIEVVKAKIQEEKSNEKISEISTEIKEEKNTPSIEINSLVTVIQELKQPTEEKKIEVTRYEESVSNLKEHLFLFTEILLNKKLTESDWDKRIPESALLDHRNYHRLIYLLINLNSDIEQTTSRFKLVLETTNEVAINHQIYFRNWMMPAEMIATFKSANNFSINKKEIRIAAQIAEQKNWKLQASTSEQGTMINLLMKLQLKKEG